MMAKKVHKLEKGSIYQKIDGGDYYYRYQVNGQRKAVCLKTKNLEQAKKAASKYLPVVNATHTEVIAAHVQAARGLRKKKLSLPLSEVWTTYAKHPNRANPATVSEQEAYRTTFEEFLKFIGEPHREFATITTATVDEFVVHEYNAYGERISEDIDGFYFQKSLKQHYDSFGRNIGYSVDSDRKATYLYSNRDGQLSEMDVGDVKNFAFGRIPNTRVINAITYPNDMVKTITYESNRNMITSVSLDRNDSNISLFSYTNDTLGRRTSMARSYEGLSDEFQYGYNDRGELTSAQNPDLASSYVYDYDNIGNRKTASEEFDFEGVYQYGSASNATQYSTNVNNQYTLLTDTTNATTKTITFDADGNQTRIYTSLGSWDVEYDAENRPVKFVNLEWGGTYTMSYDFMGRRFMKCSIWSQGADYWEYYEYFSYDNYLQIERFNDYGIISATVWDPTDMKNSKPLGVKLGEAPLDGYYGVYHYISHDANKNVTDVVKNDGIITSHYEYTPYGELLRADEWSITELCMFRFSSEYYDAELGLYYYNFRHYNPTDGRWLSRDPIKEFGGYNLYGFVYNNPTSASDYLGLMTIISASDPCPKNPAGGLRLDNLTIKPCEQSGKKYFINTFTYSYRTNEQNGTPTPNGCGPQVGGDWVPDEPIPGVTFEPACDKHDICWGTCGKKRTECDNEFFQNLLNQCQYIPHLGTQIRCIAYANIYYLAVASNFASKHYDAAQDQFCKRKTCSVCKIK